MCSLRARNKTSIRIELGHFQFEIFTFFIVLFIQLLYNYYDQRANWIRMKISEWPRTYTHMRLTFHAFNLNFIFLFFHFLYGFRYLFHRLLYAYSWFIGLNDRWDARNEPWKYNNNNIVIFISNVIKNYGKTV